MRGSIISDGSGELENLIESPTRPYLAFGRRHRSFTSPFQINKARYVLSFANADTAQQWWDLIQSEYPDSMREDPQLFSFKSDYVPAKAQDNPRFSHLAGKWSFRQIHEKTGSETDLYQDPSKRAFLAHTPSMASLREERAVAACEKLEDPFTPAEPSKTDFAQLNLASENIKKTVSQSTLQLDVLLEGQQTSARSFQTLAGTIEHMAEQMTALARRQQEHEIVLRELTAAATAHNAASDVQYRHQQAAALQSLQSTIEETCGRVQQLYDRPPTASDSHKDDLQRLQKEMAQNSKALRTLADRPTQTPTAELLQSLRQEISQNTATMQTLTDSQKTTRKHLQKLQASVDTTAMEQKSLAAQLKQTHALSETTHALTVRLASNQDLKFEQLETKMDRQAAQTRKLMAAQQENFRSSLDEVLTAVKQQQTLKVDRGHEVLPPPRKVNRKLVGYVYEKE